MAMSGVVGQVLAGQVIEHLPGMNLPLRRLRTGAVVAEIDYRDNPAHDERWADVEAAPYGGPGSIFWQQNMERILIRGGQAVWPMLDRQVHVRPFPLSELGRNDWAVFRSLDHGMRHPTCCAWVAVRREREGASYVFYRQYYATDLVIALNTKAIRDLTPAREHVHGTVADPAIWKRNDQTGELAADVYAKNGMPLVRGDNSSVGYEAVTSAFVSTLARWTLFKKDLERLRTALRAPSLTMGDARQLAAAPAAYFAPACAAGRVSLFEQCLNFRWRELTGDASKKAPPEDFQDVDDEGPDVVRYAIQTTGVSWSPDARRRRPADLLQRALERAEKRGDTRLDL